jgi:hypothetical protein
MQLLVALVTFPNVASTHSTKDFRQQPTVNQPFETYMSALEIFCDHVGCLLLIDEHDDGGKEATGVKDFNQSLPIGKR